MLTYQEFRDQINPAVWIESVKGVKSDHLSQVIFYPKLGVEAMLGNPNSSLTRLIQGIYVHDPAFARAHLRAPIIYDPARVAFTQRDQGMIKVAAKRTRTLEAHQGPIDLKVPVSITEIDFLNPWDFKKQSAPFKISEITTLDEAMSRLRIHCALIPKSMPRALQSRPEAALLLSREGEVLAWAENTNHPNRTLHAEVNLVQSWWRETKKPIPEGSTFVTTLKPCKMCAGMIYDSCENPSTIDVVYDRFDPGPFGRNTILNGRQYGQDPSIATSI